MGQSHKLSKEQRAAVGEIFENTRLLSALAQRSGMPVLAYLLEMATIEAYELNAKPGHEADLRSRRRLQH